MARAVKNNTVVGGDLKTLLRLTSASLLALSAAACATQEPPLQAGDLPGAFDTKSSENAPLLSNRTWWTAFGSDELSSLQARAGENNLDLRVAMARVTQSYASAGVAFAPLLPNINATAGFSRAGNEATDAAGPNAFSLGAAASYELDFWGANRNAYSSARASANAQRYAMATTNLTLTANVANAYFSLLALRERLAIARQSVEAAERILEIAQLKASGGVFSGLDLAQQQATVAQQRARIPALEQQSREALRAVALLMGRAPEGFAVQAQDLTGLSVPVVSAGLPSEILTRRPDIAQAEANLAAAHANTNAARAAFLPKISVGGTGTYRQVGDAVNLLNPANLAWNVSATLVQSIFGGGSLYYRSVSQRANETALLATYRSVVFAALNDVENATGQSASSEAQLVQTTEQERASGEAFRISELRYRQGVTDMATMLQTEQSWFTAQDTLVQVKLARLQAAVAMYRALGGGWTQSYADANQPERPGLLP